METQRGGRRGSVYDVPLNHLKLVPDAMHYQSDLHNLFEWIVSRINVSMKPPWFCITSDRAPGTTSFFLSIADHY